MENELNKIKEASINLLKKSKRKKILEFIENFPEFFLKIWLKTPKVPEFRYIKDVWRIKDTRLLTITANLYNEYFIDEIFKEKYKNWKYVLDFSFHQKVNLLYAADLISKSLFNDLLTLVQLRNKYAHDLEFDVIDFDVSKFTVLK